MFDCPSPEIIFNKQILGMTYRYGYTLTVTSLGTPNEGFGLRTKKAS